MAQPEPDTEAPAPLFYVDAGYSPATPGWGESCFTGLPEALASAPAGGTVQVASGVYLLPEMAFDQDIEVIGAGAQATIIQPAETITSNGWWSVSAGVRLGLRDCSLVIASNQVDQAAVAIRTRADAALSMNHCLLELPPGCQAIDAGSPVRVDRNYWGIPEPDFASIVDTNLVVVEPWYADAAMTLLAFRNGSATFADGFTLEADETIDVETVTVGADAVLSIQGGRLALSNLDMADSGSVSVSDGEVVFRTNEGETTVAGSFTLYDSMGSMLIQSDTEFSGDTLALVSHIIVSAGVTIRVSGTLVLDGCKVDCASPGGSYDWIVADGADFQMSRTHMAGCGDLTVSNAKTEIQSCVFDGTAVNITTQASGVRMFHNVMRDGASLNDEGTGTVTEVDEWGNVEDGAAVQNVLSLDFSDENLPPGRTRDEDGLFIQPEDTVDLLLNLSALQVPVSGCEALLGYNGTYFTNGYLALEAPWEFNLAEAWDFKAGDPLYGEINTGIGLGMSAPREGTTSNGAVARISMQAKAKEGDTVFYFRPQISELWDTRLASDTNGLSGRYLTPFTQNSISVTVDGTKPLLSGFDGLQTQSGGSVNVFDETKRTLPGTVVIMIEASDALSGLVDPQLIVRNRNNPQIELAPVRLTTLNIGTGILDIWTLLVTPSHPSGIFDVLAVVADRSGNTVTNTASLDITAEIRVNIDLQVTTGNAFEQVVSLIPLDINQQALLGYGRPLVFTAGRASVLLQDIPYATAYLRVKGATNLSRIKPVVFDASMRATVDFTGSAALICGDLNNDNLINLLDYGMLRYYWLTTAAAADINHDGVVNLFDYGILRANWLGQGQ